MKTKKLFLLLLVVVLLPLSAGAQNAEQWEKLKSDVCLLWCNDMGRNGYYDQKPIAQTMGNMAEVIGPEAVIAVGDIHHFNGVASVSDPLWTYNYEEIYSHPELMCFWYPVLGNHEYRGNTQAVLDYAKVSRRWAMPARYYSKVFSGKNCSLRIVFLDTTPLIDRYREDSITYPDAHKQDRDAELAWLDKTLSDAKEDWVIVVGHHPVFAESSKNVVERQDMQKYVLPILRKHKNVAVYGCGHIHNFQYLRMPGDNIIYWVNTAGALSRKAKPIEGTVWCSGATGFTVISADKQHLTLSAIDKDGNILYQASPTPTLPRRDGGKK